MDFLVERDTTMMGIEEQCGMASTRVWDHRGTAMAGKGERKVTSFLSMPCYKRPRPRGQGPYHLGPREAL